MGIIRDSGFSCNSNWFNRIRRAKSGPFRVVDDSGNNNPKRLFLFLKNAAFDFNEDNIPWQSFYVTPSHPMSFSFFGVTEVVSILGSTLLPRFIAVAGKKYIANNGDIPMSGNSDDIREFKIQNGHSTDTLTVFIKRNGYVIGTYIFAPGDSQSFYYNTRLWIGLTKDGSVITEQNVNTELSLLGVIGADIKINSNDSFTLQNIVF